MSSTNLNSLGTAGRAILVAVDLTEQSVHAAQWVIHEYARKGDTLHLVHVARILAPQLTIHHQYHATYDVPDPKPRIDENAFLDKLREAIKKKFQEPIEAAGLSHALHLFLDTDNAPASAVCDSMFKVAEQIDANLLVLAAHGKDYEGGRDPWGHYLGSVADHAAKNSKRPIVVIRDYRPPLVLPAHKSHSAAKLEVPVGAAVKGAAQ